MELYELKTKIIEKDLPHILIFTGEETTLQSVYIKEIAKQYNANYTYADEIIDIKKQLLNNTSFSKPCVYVVRNSKDFQKNEDLWEDFSGKIKKDKYLILIYDSIDKRGRFYKRFENDIITFDLMTTEQLKRVVSKKLKLNDNNLALFIELCSNNYGRITLELDKLLILKDYIDGTDDEVFKYALRNNLIYQQCSDTSFELVSALLDYNAKLSFQLLKELKEFEDAPLKLIGLLYNNYKNLLLLKGDKDVNISGYVKKLLLPYINKHYPNELIYKLRLIQKVERGIKLGEIEADDSLDYLIINLLY